MPPSAKSLAAGHAYQRSLLAALGDDDPAVSQAAQPDILRTLIADAGDDLRTRPAERVVGRRADRPHR